MSQSGISYIDVAICFVLLIFIFIGYKRGFTEEFIRIAGFAIAFIVATRYMSIFTPFFVNSWNLDPALAIIVSFVAIFLFMLFVFRLLGQKTKKAVSFSMALGGADKMVGGALGMFKGAIIVSLLTLVLKLYGAPPAINDQIITSHLYNPMLKVAPAFYNVVKRFIPRANPFDVELEKNVMKVQPEKRGYKTDDFIYELRQND